MKKVVACLLIILFSTACSKTENAITKQSPLIIDSSVLSLPGVSGALDSFQITYPGHWTISIDPSAEGWLAVSTTGGTGNTKIVITTEATNSTASARTANIMVKGESSEDAATLTVHQAVFTPTPFSNVIGGAGKEQFNTAIAAGDGGYLSVGFATSAFGDLTALHGKKDMLIVKTNAAGTRMWAKTFGGSGDEEADAIVAAENGGFIISGYTASNDGDVSGNHGDWDAWVIKIDGSGNKIWSKCFGGSSTERGFGLTTTIDGNYLMASDAFSSDGDVSGNHSAHNGDAWIVKFDGQGNILWSKAYGGTGQEMPVSVTKSADGGYVVAGYSDAFKADGDVFATHGMLDIWIFKIDAQGALLWQKDFGGSGTEFPYQITTTGDGAYVVAGFTSSNNGDITSNKGQNDSWILKVDDSGNLLWQKTYGGSLSESAKSIISLPQGECMISGYTYSNDGDVSGNKGGSDAWVMKIATDGSLLWQKTFGGSLGDFANVILPAENENYFVAGYSGSSDGDIIGSHGNDDAWIFTFQK